MSAVGPQPRTAGAPGHSGSDDVDALELTTKLTDEFRTTLDETVIIAILSDYDLTNAAEHAQAHSTLTTIARDVTAEEASVFHAPCLGYADEPAPANPTSTRTTMEPDPAETSQGTTDSAHLLSDTSSNTDWAFPLPHRLADLDLPEDGNAAALDEDGKVAELKVMFSGLSAVDLTWTLKKVKGDFAKAVEELLNLQYLEEEGLRPKGIDGAFRDDHMVDYQRLSSSSRERNRDRGKTRLDVDYRLSPLNLSEGDDDSSSQPAMPPPRPLRRTSLPRLVPARTVVGAAPLSAPISPVAAAAAAAATTRWQTVAPRQKTYTERATEATASHAAATATLDAAAAAYRRARSDPLHRPVAGELAARARAQREQARHADAARFEALVDRSAGADVIDLHGVPVADGVRIALDRTQAWWAALGEDRARKARADGGGFVVVTGLGNHSTGGVSRLRQDVGAALKRAGWRVRVETGHFVVTGKA